MIPNATATFSDSFLPRIGISKILSASERIFGEIPLTSCPTTRAIFLFVFWFYQIIRNGIFTLLNGKDLIAAAF